MLIGLGDNFKTFFYSFLLRNCIIYVNCMNLIIVIDKLVFIFVSRVDFYFIHVFDKSITILYF